MPSKLTAYFVPRPAISSTAHQTIWRPKIINRRRAGHAPIEGALASSATSADLNDRPLGSTASESGGGVGLIRCAQRFFTKAFGFDPIPPLQPLRVCHQLCRFAKWRSDRFFNTKSCDGIFFVIGDPEMTHDRQVEQLLPKYCRKGVGSAAAGERSWYSLTGRAGPGVNPVQCRVRARGGGRLRSQTGSFFWIMAWP